MTKHLSDYLSYYQNLRTPGYAVLVTGQWGVGKTHQVRQFITDDKHYYVSLFGLRTTDEAHAAVYASYAPTLDKFNRSIGAIGEAAQNAGGYVSLAGAATGWLSAALRQQVKPDRTLIFDDLERCGMSLEEMMGVFSTYLDQHGFRVVLIADEEKLAEKHKGYREAKEKVVGHTARAEPMTSNAFDDFVGKLDDSAKAYIEERKQQVLEVFEASGCLSLRVLRHVISDLARLYQSLDPEQIQNDAAMHEIIGLFVACGIEVRMGRLKAGDLQDRQGKRWAFKMKRDGNETEAAEQPPFVTADDRYPTIDLENQILDDHVLKDVFEHGVFDAERIVASVKRSPHFLDLGEIPAWKRVISFAELDDGSLSEALETMNRQFVNREVTSSGEMLHMFALRLMMSEEGVIATDLEATRNECLKYINNLLAAGRLPPRELDWQWRGSFARAHDGYSYWVNSTYQDHFNALRDRLVAAREEALEAAFPEKMEELLAILAYDGVKFYRQLCHTAGHDSPYAAIPILKSLEPGKFVDAWLASPRPSWYWVRKALEDRLEPHRVRNELASERDWALEVLRVIEERSNALTGFDHLRVRRIIPDKLRELEADEAVETEVSPER